MSDAALWYNAPGWADYGLAVPNWSDDHSSQNSTIRELVATTGRNLQNIMFHTDARLTTPPSINTLHRVHRLCIRIRDILSNRALPLSQLNMEPVHAVPAPEVFLVYPTQYFKVRNTWLKDWCGLVLTALTEAMQHTENARPFEISVNFAQQYGQYFARIYQRMAVELLKVPAEEAKKPDFTIATTVFDSYNPNNWFTLTEMIDTVPDLENWPTEDQLAPLTQGIPVIHLPKLGRWPASTIKIPTTTSTNPSASGWQTTPLA